MRSYGAAAFQPQLPEPTDKIATHCTNPHMICCGKATAYQLTQLHSEIDLPPHNNANASIPIMSLPPNLFFDDVYRFFMDFL